MATRTTDNLATLTCPACNVTVSQAPGTKRTICPHCGNFYDPQAPRERPRARENRASDGTPTPGPRPGTDPDLNNRRLHHRSANAAGHDTPESHASSRQAAEDENKEGGEVAEEAPNMEGRLVHQGHHYAAFWYYGPHRAAQGDTAPPNNLMFAGGPPTRRQRSTSAEPRERPRRQDKERSGGRLQSLANFFQNLGPNRRAKSGDASRRNHRDIPLQTRSLNHTPVAPPSTSSHASNTQLPPIASDSQNFLTVDHPSQVRSLPAKSPSPLVPSSPRSPTQDLQLSFGSQSNATLHRNRPPSAKHPSQTLSRQSSAKHKVIYPVRNKTVEQLRDDIQTAKDTGNWMEVQDYYATTFDSFIELNAAFKRDPEKEYKTVEESGVKLEQVYCIYDLLLDLPQDIQKVVLKAIINSLLKDKRPHTKDDLRSYLVLLQNPQFGNIATYVIFAHLLRQIASLHDHDHHFLVHWLKKIERKRFRNLIQKLHSFISCRLFPPKIQDLPPMSKCTWWIPSATKVLALLNAANNLSLPLLASYTDFYNSTLDHLDLMAEYYTWQNPSAHPGFSFCQYPFILSITAKRTILQRDSEQQMIIMARRSLVAKVQRRQMPDIGMLFLNLTVRRSHLVSDSLNEIARKQHDLKKKLKVTFAGEPGLDMGGLTKEWFLLLIRQIFKPDYGMFSYDRTARAYWFNSAPCENYQEFNLVGVLMGLAVYNSINLDIRFPPCCYKKLLSPAVVPYNNPRAHVGVSNLSLKDLKLALPDLAHGLQELLDYEGDVEMDFCLTFQISYKEFGSVRLHTLKAGGETIPVTNKNRKGIIFSRMHLQTLVAALIGVKTGDLRREVSHCGIIDYSHCLGWPFGADREYVHLYIDFLLNKSIYHQFQAFYHGFHSVCASNALIMLRPEEVEMLVCGCPDINMVELKKVTVYDGYTLQDPTIKHFWEVILNFSQTLQKQLLLFATGSDRIPVGGMAEMQFKITKVTNTDMLPMAHTCFNQLVLPSYRQKKLLKQKLLIAIQNAEGFGIE